MKRLEASFFLCVVYVYFDRLELIHHLHTFKHFKDRYIKVDRLKDFKTLLICLKVVISGRGFSFLIFSYIILFCSFLYV